MSALERNSSSKSFQLWLTANSFEHCTLPLNRANGESEILLFGLPSEANRPTVIFLHGLGNDVFFPNIDFFRYILAHGFNIATCDIDGHGIGGTTVFLEDDVSRLVEDVVRQLDRFKIGAPKYHFCGYSFGAVLQLNYGVSHPERVASLTLIGMPKDLSSRILMATELLTPLFKSFRDALPDYGILGVAPAIGWFNRRRFPVRLHKAEKRDYLRMAAKIIGNINPEKLLPKVLFPTIEIVGSLDFIANKIEASQGVTKWPIKHVTLVGETHFSSMISKKCPRLVVEFIKSVGRETSA
jgi:pimeloyl-ACP methyl ester carboxylesterase